MQTTQFKKVLAANRGEIAIRIFRACHDLSLRTVAMYSSEDTNALFRIKADEAYLIGKNKSPLQAYLDIPSVIELAKHHGVDAIHPGYGFLSENAEFAKACEDNDITFIGPPSSVLAKMGDKLEAKQIALAAKVPTIPGTTEPVKCADDAVKIAESFGFPVILKAAAGGGGRGMRRCDSVAEVRDAFRLVKGEAKKAFNNDDIFIEKFLVNPKHIEVQILADKYGNIVHLGERDCSLQRRFQKVVEYAPAFSVPEETRAALQADAVKIARQVGYISAGTVEFLVDSEGHHYFIEMNPRIQVEHTVSEMVTGVDIVRFPEPIGERGPGLKPILDKQGPVALSKHVLDEKKLLITDTTMRDAHQSLLSTRMRTRDMLKGAEGTSEILADAFSLEMWGGATFDTAFRFLYEDPWERLEKLRALIPNIPFQMLLRGANAVGYTNYPDNVIRKFVEESAKAGIDIFRVFDSLNWIPGMEVAMDEVIKQGKFCEATICYTGDILDPKNDKFDLKYYVNMAKELEKRGAHMIAIKDMSGLLKPYAGKQLVTALKNEIGLPIHLHTHDTTSNQIAMYLMAAEAGVDVVDVTISSLSALTSQPSMNALVAALQGQERDTGLDLDRLQELTDYWEDVRRRYKKFDAGLKTPVTDIYKYEIPGGQYTNLYPQVQSIGLGDRFQEVKEMYKTVNDMLGGIVKVTPSSKMVGDLAIFMIQNDLTPENICTKGADLSYPDSVVSYFKGMMGQPSWGFPEDLQKVVLKGEEPITCRPGELLEPVDFDWAREQVAQFEPDPSDQMLISWCLYPKVVEDYCRHKQEYGYIMRMGSHVFFDGLALGETNQINIEDGKTLVIRYLGLGDLHDDGTRDVHFELNGTARTVTVPDPHASSSVKAVVLADPTDKSEVGASIPGLVSKIHVKPGDKVTENQVIAIVEAMKMETSVTARMDGIVDEVLVQEGDNVKAGELMIKLKL